LLEIEYDSLFAVGGLDDNFIHAELYNNESVYNNALKNRANFRSAELQVHGNKLNTALIKTRYFPIVSAGVVAGKSYLNGSNNPFSTRVFITASVPIFDKFETKNLLQKNKVQTKLAELNLMNEKKELYKAIEQLKYYSIAAKAKWESAVKSEKISLETYNYLKSKYDSGKATVYELYQAKTDLVLQNSAALQAKYEYYFQQKMIQNLMN
jgi:outer membrane protein